MITLNKDDVKMDDCTPKGGKDENVLIKKWFRMIHLKGIYWTTSFGRQGRTLPPHILNIVLIFFFYSLRLYPALF